MLLGSFAWGRAGVAGVDGGSGEITLSAAGLRSLALRATKPPIAAKALASLQLPLHMSVWPRAAFMLGDDGVGVGDAATAFAGAEALSVTMALRRWR